MRKTLSMILLLALGFVTSSAFACNAKCACAKKAKDNVERKKESN